MIKEFIFTILKKIGLFFLNLIFNFIDKDKDGVIEKDEIESLIKEINSIINKKRKK
jgi:Ca2+-binding EF-hand superfamily protein